jgi:hypothetical protein
MKNKPASTPLPTTTTDADDTRIDVDQLETEAQTHDRRRDDSEKEKPVVPSGSATREETGALRLLLLGKTSGRCLLLCTQSAPLNAV